MPLSPKFYQKILEQYENYKAPLNSVLKVTNSQMQKCKKCCPKKALELFYEMKGCLKKYSENPNVISYSAAISASEKAGDSKTALALLSEMKESGIEPNVISYSATISACEKAGDSKTVSSLSKMKESWNRA